MRLFLLGSIRVVTGAGAPPAAETRNRPLVTVGANTMVPSRFQVPPTPMIASQRVTGGPPATSIFFSLPRAKKPMNRPSGDQNGNAPPSVPEARALLPHRTTGPPARLPASGVDTKGDAPAVRRKRLRDRCDRMGAAADNRAARGRRDLKSARGGRRRSRARELQRAKTDGRRGRHGGHHPRQARARTTGCRRHLAVNLRAGFAIHCNSRSRSRALCHRSSGSFARHAPTTRSSAGGVSGCSAEMGGRVRSRIARDQARLALALERLLARQHLVEHRAEREDVRARVGLAAFELLRRHVLKRPEDRALRREARAASSAASTGPPPTPAGSPADVQQSSPAPKSSSFAPALRQHDVAGLQVAMDDARAMRLVERARRSGSRSSAPDRAAARPSPGDRRASRLRGTP